MHLASVNLIEPVISRATQRQRLHYDLVHTRQSAERLAAPRAAFADDLRALHKKPVRECRSV